MDQRKLKSRDLKLVGEGEEEEEKKINKRQGETFTCPEKCPRWSGIG